MTDGNTSPASERPSLAYMAGVIVGALMKLPAILRDAAVAGFEEAAARSAARTGGSGRGGTTDEASGAATRPDGAGPSGAPRAGATEPVMLSSRSMRLVERAQALAAAGREDAAAVDELVLLCGHDDGDNGETGAGADVGAGALRTAAAWFQESAWNLESRAADRAYRLLTAAIRRDSVRPVAPEAEARFARLEDLQSIPPPEAWARLCELEPSLAAVAEDARAGRLGRAVPLPGGGAGPEPGGAWLAAERRLRDRLQPLVGPGAQSPEWLVRTAVAYRIAADHVRGLRPA